MINFNFGDCHYSREPIFDKVYEFCSENPISKSAYLESLEPYILNDQLRILPPIIVKEFITHYDEIGNYKVVLYFYLLLSTLRITVDEPNVLIFFTYLGCRGLHSTSKCRIPWYSSNNETMLDARALRRNNLYLQSRNAGFHHSVRRINDGITKRDFCR